MEKEDGMSRKRYKPEQIINHLRQAEILISQGQTIGQVSRALGISEQSYYLYGRLSHCKLTVI
jgi:putative transposase